MSLEFWNSQAQKYGHAGAAVNFDPIEDDLELYFLTELVADGDVVCDLGCGNGRTLIHLAKQKKRSVFYGVDFSPAMIAAAVKRSKALKLRNVHFFTMSAADERLPKLFTMKFDKIITKRLLINVKGVARKAVVRNIHALLRARGTYIMAECFIEPLHKINNIRCTLGLPAIKVNSFNEYLTAGFLKDITRLFSVQERLDFESLYYFTSRIFNAYLSHGKPDYYAPINKLSAVLIKSGVRPIEGYAPEAIFLLKKRPIRTLSAPRRT